MTFGQFFGELRKRNGLSLREFCDNHGYHAGNVSRIEHDLLRAPQSDKKLNAYAKAFGLKKNSPEWIKFHDLANASNKSFEVKNITSAAVLQCVAELIRMIDRSTFTQDEALNLARMANALLQTKSNHVD